MNKTKYLYNALIKLNHCGYCATNKNNNDKQLNLFCNYIATNKEVKNVSN
jgi:hypothetical protein